MSEWGVYYRVNRLKNFFRGRLVPLKGEHRDEPPAGEPRGGLLPRQCFFKGHI